MRKPSIVTALALVGLLAFVGLLARSDTALASTFNPSFSVGLSDTAAAANADILQTFGIGVGADGITPSSDDTADSNFGGVVFFTDPAWGMGKDADVADGAIVGRLDANATLGLLSNPCNNGLGVSFTMMDATTNPSSQVTFEDGFLDGDGNNLADAVDHYPDFLTRVFTGITPIARQYGQTDVSGVEVALNFLVFEPGTVITTPATTLVTDPALGYPSVTVLQALGDPDVTPEVGTITDFCAPLATNPSVFAVAKDNICTNGGALPTECKKGPTKTIIGVEGSGTSPDEGGGIVRTNPSDGAYNFTLFARSLRDADDDGHENSLDTCAFDANPDWNPRAGDAIQPGQDTDGDGLGDVCDPDPNLPSLVSGGQRDEDRDWYSNRQDNCPLEANGVPTQDGPDGNSQAGQTNQKDSDFDGIGDACDTDPSTPSGHDHAVCLVAVVTVGSGGTPAVNPENLQPCDPNAPLTGGDDTTPTPTPTADGTPGAATNNTGGPGGPSTGVGALAPVAVSIPTWAAIASGFGGAGILGGLSAIASRVFGIRFPDLRRRWGRPRR